MREETGLQRGATKIEEANPGVKQLVRFPQDDYGLAMVSGVQRDNALNNLRVQPEVRGPACSPAGR